MQENANKPQDPEFAPDEVLQICNGGQQSSPYLPAKVHNHIYHHFSTITEAITEKKH